MAQPQSREQIAALPDEKAHSSVTSAEQGVTGEQDFDLSGVRELREPPSSGVGYGGGDERYHQTPNMPNQGYWEERSRGDDEEESRYGQDSRASDSSGTVEQRRGSGNYGTVNPNARPSEAGFGSSGAGGYPDEGDYGMGSFGDASSKQSGTRSTGGIVDESSRFGSEVRNGVRHGVTSHGVSSGAGVSKDLGSRSPNSSDMKQHEYHLTEETPSQQEAAPYSQMLTELDGVSEGSRDRFQEEEGITGNTKGGTAVDHKSDHLESEGFFKRLVGKLPGHDHNHEVVDSTSDVKEVGSNNVRVEREDTGCLPKLKNKVHEKHDKHRDEINPEVYQ